MEIYYCRIFFTWEHNTFDVSLLWSFTLEKGLRMVWGHWIFLQSSLLANMPRYFCFVFMLIKPYNYITCCINDITYTIRTFRIFQDWWTRIRTKHIQKEQ